MLGAHYTSCEIVLTEIRWHHTIRHDSFTKTKQIPSSVTRTQTHMRSYNTFINLSTRIWCTRRMNINRKYTIRFANATFIHIPNNRMQTQFYGHYTIRMLWKCVWESAWNPPVITQQIGYEYAKNSTISIPYKAIHWRVVKNESHSLVLFQKLTNIRLLLFGIYSDIFVCVVQILEWESERTQKSSLTSDQPSHLICTLTEFRYRQTVWRDEIRGQ